MKRISIGVIAVSTVVIVAALVMTVIPRNVSGTAQPSAAAQATQKIAPVMTNLASAPGVTYNGTVSDATTSAQVQQMNVTNSGVASGDVNVHGKSAKYLEINGQVWLNGSPGFWEAAGAPANSNSDPDGQWASASPGQVVPDIAQILAPQQLAFALTNSRDTSGSGVGQWTSTDAGSTPDARRHIDTDPAGQSLPSPGHGLAAVSFAGFQSQFDPASNQLRQAKGRAWTTSGRPANVDVKVTVMTKDQALQFYSTTRDLTNDIRLAVLPMAQIDVPDPQITMTPTPCGPFSCSAHIALSNTVTGVDSGTVVAHLTATWTVNGATLPPCTEDLSMPINASAGFDCPAAYSAPNGGNVGVHVNGNYSVQTQTNVQVLVQSLDDCSNLVNNPINGKWEPVGYKPDANANAYNRQITGAPYGFAFVVAGVPFDSVAPDGSLVMSQGPGYASHLAPDGSFDPGWAGTHELIQRAQQQTKAAGQTPITWVFAEQAAADAANKLFAANGIKGITAQYVAPQ